MTGKINKLKFWHYLQGGFLCRVHLTRLRKAVKILMAVVISALLLAGLYALFGDMVMPTLTCHSGNVQLRRVSPWQR